jgi:hypothetical protein
MEKIHIEDLPLNTKGGWFVIFTKRGALEVAIKKESPEFLPGFLGLARVCNEFANERDVDWEGEGNLIDLRSCHQLSCQSVLFE